MDLNKIEPIYKKLEESITLLQTALDVSYFDALIETGDNLLDGGNVQVEDGKPNAEQVATLEKIYSGIDLDLYTAEEMRKLFQLLLLKGYRQEKIQANHQMTPDAIGILVADILQNSFLTTQELSILDLSVGTGNLLLTVNNNLVNKQVKLAGVDNDDTLLTLASLNSQLEKVALKLYHQDAMQPLLVDPVDVVLSDLPVGYYPIDENVTEYMTKAQECHSYMHHLLIEQSFNYLKEGGLGVYIVPQNIFETTESKSLLKFIQTKGHLQAVLNLPKELFGNKTMAKTILVLQKQGGKAKQAENVLLGDIPSFKDLDNLKKFMAELNQWLKNNIKI